MSAAERRRAFPPPGGSSLDANTCGKAAGDVGLWLIAGSATHWLANCMHSVEQDPSNDLGTSLALPDSISAGIDGGGSNSRGRDPLNRWGLLLGTELLTVLLLLLLVPLDVGRGSRGNLDGVGYGCGTGSGATRGWLRVVEHGR